jgi:hypothetical protein
MHKRLSAVLVGLLALGPARTFAQTVQAGPEWTQGRSGGWGNRGDHQKPDERSSEAPSSARSVVVPANVAWTNTQIRVTRGQRLRVEPSGEILLSFNAGDLAVPAGARGRVSATAPVPSVDLGALIGRVNNGKPFAIGNSTQALAMPATGTLFLAVNDDHVGDNSGNYVVKIWEP